MQTLKAWLLTPIFYLGLAGVFLFFEIEFRVGQLLGRPAFYTSLDRLHYYLVGLLKLIGCSIEVQGEEKLEPGKHYLFLSNHQSMFDLCLLYTALTPLRPVFVPKKELARGIPSISYVISRDGSAIIDRTNPKQSIRALSDLGKRAKEKNLAVILFPAGTRSKDGSIGPYKHSGLGAFLKSASQDLKIIPTYVQGPCNVVGGMFKPVGADTELKIILGEEIDPTSVQGNYKSLVKNVENWTREQYDTHYRTSGM